MGDRSASMRGMAGVLAFPFRGKGWEERLAAGVGLLLLSIFIPILPAIVVYGYLLKVMNLVINGKEPSLPPWQDFGTLFVDGLKSFLVGSIYLLPGAFVLACGCGLYFCVTMVLTFASSSPSASLNENGVASLFLLAMIVFFVSLPVGMILTMLGTLPLPVAQAQLAETSSFGQAFALGRFWRHFRANPGGYLVAWFMVFGVWAFMGWGVLLLNYTFVLACFGPVLSTIVGYYALLIGAVLFGQAFKDSTAKLKRAKAL
jgi:Protein of unknown function (DUF4013)